MKYFSKNQELLFFLCLVVLYFIWSFCDFFIPAKAGLDYSWIIGLNWAKDIGAQWGKDILFTYGPLYHFAGVLVPDFYSSKAYLLILIGINLFYSLIKTGVVFIFYRRANSLYKMFITMFSGFVMLLCVYHKHIYSEIITLFSIILLCDSYYEIRENKMIINKRVIINNVLASFLLVIAQYMKFSYFNVVVVLLILLNILYIFHNKYKITVIFTGSYIFFSFFLWIISGQNIKNLFGYFYTGFQLSGGYTSAMNIPFVNSNNFDFFTFASIIILLFIIMLIYILKKKNIYLFIYLF